LRNEKSGLMAPCRGVLRAPAIAFWCIVPGLSLIWAGPRGLDRRHLTLISLTGLVVVAYALVLHEQLASHPWLGLTTGVFARRALLSLAQTILLVFHQRG
jgi:hypothetical protein